MFSITSPSSGITVTLMDQKTWKEFHPDTEMIVTKQRGRVIFPHLKYNFDGLESDTLYTIFLHLERVDSVKYKFDAAEWKEAGKGDAMLPIKHLEHPEGARRGSHWMADSVSFAHVKMTNDPEKTDGNLILVQSMHKYRPVITIKKSEDPLGEEFRLMATEFMVVTAYQSQKIIDLKVRHNKFASGFRTNGKRRQSGDSENSPPASKKCTPSSGSTSSTPPTVSPMAQWDQSWMHNPLAQMAQNTQYPIVAQNTAPTPQPQPTVPMVPLPYSFYDFNGATPFNWNAGYNPAGYLWNMNVDFNQNHMMNQMNMNMWNYHK